MANQNEHAVFSFDIVFSRAQHCYNAYLRLLKQVTPNVRMSTFQQLAIDWARYKMLLFLLLLPLSHSLRFHPYFTPGMLLQRDATNIIWGYDAVGEVRATLSCSGKKGEGRRKAQSIGSAAVSAEGFWQVELPRRSAGMVCDFEAISETEELVLEDLLIGDIWLCSGQSNMEQSMSNIMNATEEIEASASFPTIRFTVVQNAVSAIADPDAEVELAQAWAGPDDKEKLGGMSAVCFLFAR